MKKDWEKPYWWEEMEKISLMRRDWETTLLMIKSLLIKGDWEKNLLMISDWEKL